MARNLLDDYMNQPKRQGNKNLLDEYIKMSTPKLDTTAYTNMLNTLLNSSAVTGNGYQTPAVMASAANTARKAQQIAEKYGIGDSSYRQYLDSVASGVQGKQQFMSQFTGQQDYNQRYAYPQTVKGKTDAEIEAMIGAVPKAQNLLNRAAAFGKGTGSSGDDAYQKWLTDYFNNQTVTGLDRQIADNQGLLDANKAKQEGLLTSAYVPENVGLTAADRKAREDYIAQYPNQERQEMEWTEMATGLAGWEEQKQIIEEMIKELQESGSFDQAKMDELQDSWLDAERHIHNLEEQMDAYTAPDEAERLAGQETHTYVVATPEQERLDALYYQYLDELDKDNKLKYETGPEQWAYDRDMQLSGLTSEQEKLDAQKAVLNAKREEVVVRSKYNELAAAPDFKTLSVYDSSNGDSLYQFINEKGTSQEQGAAPVLGMGEFAGAVDVSAANDEASYQAAGYTFLLPDEVQAYNYIYATEGQDKAQEFLDSFVNIRNLRARSKESEEWAKYADEHGVWASVVSLGTNLAAGLAYPIQLADAAFNPNHSQFSDLYTANYATQAIRGTVGQNVAEWAGNDLGNTVYQTLMSLGDFGVALAAGKGAGALAGSGFARGMTQFIMSSEAGSSALLNNLQRGLSADKAVGMSVVSAMIEALTEKYSIDALLKEPKKAALYIAKNMLTEGSEEAASNLANTLVDLIVNADQAELAQAIAEKGYAQALTEYAQSVGMDAIMGALSGGIMGGVRVAVNKGVKAYHTAQTGKQINTNQTYKQLHDIAVAMPEGSKARKIAQGKDKLNNRKAGQLYNALMEELDAKSQETIRSTMTTEVKNRLRELGTTDNLDEAAEIIQKLWMGGKLSAREQNIIAQTPNALQVQKEVLEWDDGWVADVRDRNAGEQLDSIKKRLEVQQLASKGYRAENEQVSKALADNASTTFANASEEKGLNSKAYTEDGTTVEIKRIEEQDGKPVFVVDQGGQGMTYAIGDLHLDSYNTSALVNPLRNAQMSASAANILYHSYATSGLGAADFARAFQIAYNAGTESLGMPYVDSNTYTRILSPETRKVAYDAGRKDAKPGRKAPAKKTGSVTFTHGVDQGSLTDNQWAAIEAAKRIAPLLGVDIVFFESKANAEGKYTQANGAFHDNTLYLDVHAGRNNAKDVTEFAILRTMSHELTHYIAANDKQAYRELQDFVVTHLTEKGKSISDLVDEKKARENRKMSDAAALEEVVADACEMMLKDSTAIETLARENATLFEKMADWLRDFFDKIREAFAGVEAVHAEARALMEADADGVMHYIDGLQALWDKALVDAAHNVQAQEAQGDARIVEKFSTREDAQFETHKFFESIVDKWDGEATGGRVLIGSFRNGGIFEGIGLPAGNLYMDFSKAANALEKHSDHIDKNVIKQIPHLLSRPVVITEPANRQVKNTVNVFGELLGTNGRPIMVSVVMTPDRTGSYLLNKVRTIEMRSDVDKLITDKLVLYLDGNKKRTTEWFQGLGNSSVPFAGTKWGFIRSIAYESENNKGKLSAREDHTLTPEFKRWFGKSKVVDAEGKPLVVYHGSPHWKRFNVFKKGKTGYLGPGIYLTNQEKYAQSYADKQGPGGQLFELYAKIENPLYVKDLADPGIEILVAAYGERGRAMYAKRVAGQGNAAHLITNADINKLKGVGYDGIIWGNGKTSNYEYMVFDPTQIKSATDNVGTFDPTNPDIRYQARDADTISSRDILANARPEDYRQSAAHGFLVDYQKAYQELERLADKLDKYQKAAAGDLTPEEKYRADNRVQLAREQVIKQENKLSKLESKSEFAQVLATERETFYNAVNSMTTGELTAQIKKLEANYKAIETASAKELEDLELALEMNLGKKAAKELRTVNERNEKLKAENKALRDEVKLTGKKIDFAVAEKELALEMNLEHKREIMRQRYEKKLATLKSESAQKLAAANARGRERLEKYREKTKDTLTRSALRDRIRHDVKTLNRLLLNETDVKHVPEELKGAVAQFLTVFTQDSSVFGNRKTGEGVDENGAVFTKTILDDLRAAYGKISDRASDENRDMPQLASLYDGDIAIMLDELRDTIGDRRLSELDQLETESVHNIVKHFKHLIQKANNVFVEGRNQQISALGDEIIKAADEQKQYAGKDDPVRTMLTKGMITPSYFFKKMGGSMKKLFDDLKAGESMWGLREAEARKFFNETAKKYNYWEWAEKREGMKPELLKIETSEGKTITLTREQAMSLYATWNRETSDNGQSARHLAEGGFVYEDAMEQDKISKKVTSINTKNPFKITKDDMAKVEAWLTDEQKGYVREMVRYMSEDMAKLGNEVSMQLFGYEKYTEKNYFPYQSSKNWLYTAPGQRTATNDQRLKHASHTHKLTNFANNPIILSDFTTVWSGHVNHMILYSSMCVPLENLNRVYNYKYSEMVPAFNEKGEPEIDKNTGEQKMVARGTQHSVKNSLENAYGRKALEYIDQLMVDMNGGVRVKDDGIMNRLTSVFKKNAVMLSASVVVQQPSAMIRAMALVDPKYFAKGVAMHSSWNELKQYSGLAVIKEMGGFDTGVGESTQNWLVHREINRNSNLDAIGKELVKKDSVLRSEVMGFLPAKADELTWTHIWRAVKAETRDRTDLAVNSEAFLREAARRFDEVISYTQVYDSTLSKSQMMRNKSLNMVTAFMAEPTVTYNLLVDAFTNRGKADSVNPARAVAAFVATTLVNAMLKSIVYAARDDDEEKGFWDKYFREFTESAVLDLTFVNSIPYARDIISLIQGYDVERPDMSVISDVVDNIKNIFDDDLTGEQRAKEIAILAGNITGVPVKNVIRDVNAMLNVWNMRGTLDEAPEYTGRTFLESLTFWSRESASTYYGYIVDEMEKGNTSGANELWEYTAAVYGKTDKAIKSGAKTQLGKRYKAGKIGDAEATDILMDYFEMDADEAYWQLKEWREKEAHKDEGDYSFSRTDDLKEALLSGKTAQIEAAKTELAGVGGYTDKEVVSKAKSAIKSLYVDGQITLDKAMKLLQDQAGDMTQDDLYWTEQEWAYEKANPDGEWNKYMKVHEAIEAGKGAKEAAKELLAHGVEKGDAAKVIANKWKETYVTLYRTDRKAALDLHARILDMYVALGYSRSYQVKYIKDHWFE